MFSLSDGSFYVIILRHLHSECTLPIKGHFSEALHPVAVCVRQETEEVI